MQDDYNRSMLRNIYKAGKILSDLKWNDKNLYSIHLINNYDVPLIADGNNFNILKDYIAKNVNMLFYKVQNDYCT